MFLFHFKKVKHRLMNSTLILVFLGMPLASYANIFKNAELDFKLSTVVSTTVLDLENDAFGNPFPINGFTELSDTEYRGEFRPDFSAKIGACNATLKPRFTVQFYEDQGPLDDENETDLFFNTASLSCQLNDKLELSIGRQKYLWGNGQFRSPSNPFFAESILFNPLDEVTGKDLGILTYRPNFSWEFSIASNWDQSHVDEVPNPSAEFVSTHAVKAEYLGNNFNGGLIASTRSGHDPRLSGFGNLTVNESFILYGEFSISSDVSGLLPQRDEFGELSRFVVADEVDDKTRSTFLIGGSYTFANNWTGYLEYLHTDEGFDNRQAGELLDLANNVAPSLSTDDIDDTVLILSDAFDPLFRQLRQNYAVLQFNRVFNNSDIAFQHIQNLDDNSSTTSLSATYALSDFGEVFLVAGYNSGGGESELGRIVTTPFQFGLRIFSF